MQVAQFERFAGGLRFEIVVEKSSNGTILSILEGAVQTNSSQRIRGCRHYWCHSPAQLTANC
jgi:hypothetical protein